MINKKNIKINTYYDSDSEAYVTECDEYMNVIGCGETKEESEKDFSINLNNFLSAVKAEKAIIIKNKGGRPAKNNVKLL